MKNITVTDIFGNYIDNNIIYPFLVIHTSTPKLFLEKIVDIGNSSVYKIILSAIKYVLTSHRIDKDNYGVLGDILLPNNNTNVIKLLLINISSEYSVVPINYVQINNISGINIWKPICNSGYEALGYVTSKDKPRLTHIRCVRSDIVIMLSDNDYNIFGMKKKSSVLANDIDSMSNCGYSSWYPFSDNNIDSYSNLLESVPSTVESSVCDYDSSESWVTQEGRYLKLLKNKNPWYNTPPIKELTPTNNIQVDTISPKKPNIITGMKDKIRNSDNNFYYIISSLILIFIILITVRFYLQSSVTSSPQSST